MENLDYGISSLSIFSLTLSKTNAYNIGFALFINYGEVVLLLALLLLLIMLGIIDYSSSIVRGLQFSNVSLFNIKYKNNKYVMSSTFLLAGVFNFKFLLCLVLLTFMVGTTNLKSQVLSQVLSNFSKLALLILVCPGVFDSFHYEKSIICALSLVVWYLISVGGNWFTHIYIFGAYISSLFILCSYDFLTLLISLEVLSFCIVLVINANSAINVKAASSVFNFFILYGINSLILIISSLGICFVAGTTSLYNMSALFSVYAPDSLIYYIFGTLITLSFLFKLSVSPFYFWAPAVVECLSYRSLVFFLVFTKIVYFFILIKLFYLNILTLSYATTSVLKIFGVLSLLTAAVYNSYVPYFKQYLVYSGTAHLGFVLLALSVSNIGGFYASGVYFLFYITALFGVLFLFNGFNLNGVYVSNLFGSVRGNKHFLYMFSLLIFVLSGLPPFIGFFSKVIVLGQLVHSGDYVLVLLVGVSSVILMYSYLRVFYYLGFKQVNVLRGRFTSNVSKVTSFNILGFTFYVGVPLVTSFYSYFIYMFFLQFLVMGSFYIGVTSGFILHLF
jgi:NADH-quinone oxidoreductase subunit N